MRTRYFLSTRRMARSTRSRRVPLKYSEEEFVVQPKPKNTREKNNTDDDAKLQGSPNDGRVGRGKGNLYAKERISMFGSPVLRDRTNLLMKKGTGDDPSSGKKPTKSTKESATSDVTKKAKLVDSENRTAKIRSTRAARSNLGKEAASVKRPSTKRSKDTVGDELKRSTRRSIELKEKKDSVEIMNKFFKNKGTLAAIDKENGSPKGKPVLGKRKNIVSRAKLRMSTSFRLRQTNLKESFAKAKPKKDLRPRNALKNYCEDSTVLEKTSVEKPEAPMDGVKRPIYKTAKLPDDCENNASGIYEFEYNSNDSQEKIAKKKRKRKVGTNVVKKKSNAISTNTKKATAKRVVAKRPAKEADSEKVAKRPAKEADSEKVAKRPAKEADSEKVRNENKHHVTFDVQDDVDALPVMTTDHQPMENTAQQAAKPIIVKSVDLKGEMRIHLPGTPQPDESAKTHRQGLPTMNASMVQPSGQYRSMMNHVLLNKSLSPISKAMDNFDPSSPWRAPTFPSLQFSRVKSVFQSTPQFCKFPTMGATINKIPADDKGTVKVSQPIVDASTPKKVVTLVKSPRKFGTENFNRSQPIFDKLTPKKAVTLVKSPRKFGNENVNVSQPIVDKSTPKKVVTVVKSPRKFGNENVNVSQPIVDKSTPKKALTLVKSPRKFGTENVNIFQQFVEKPTLTKVVIPGKSPRKFGTENVNILQQFVEKPTLNKAVVPGKSPRKFGTEISNVTATNVSTKVINENSHESELDSSSTPLAAATTDLQENTIPFDDNADDKENSVPIHQSSKAENLPNSPRRLLLNSSPRKVNKLSAKMNLVPQAGPSGLQDRKSPNESRILKQSNLNNFLNLDKMPTSTRISTPHGIFDDVNTSPINGKPISSKITKEANVENAFGFDEDDNDKMDIGLSPIKPSHSNVATDNIRKRLVTKVDNKKERTDSGAAPVRLSIGEMKKHLHVPTVGKIKPVVKSRERVEDEENEDRPTREQQVVPTNNKVVTFADTFDLSTEPNELNDKENLLFADLEPVHFKQPPRHLYKRKRAATYCAHSDDEEEDRSAAACVNQGTKRRKITKLEKQQQKKIEEWAKGLNETFEEIDHFDLVVE